MTNSEKVTIGLKCWGSIQPCKGKDCPYYDENIAMADCRMLVCSDAVELLDKQKTVKPKRVKGYNPPFYTLYEYECDSCESPMLFGQKYCMGCGKPVKWK